jgi:hypothetical protein
METPEKPETEVPPPPPAEVPPVEPVDAPIDDDDDQKDEADLGHDPLPAGGELGDEPDPDKV